MVWGYLKSELQALPLEPDHTYSVGRKLDSDLVLKVRQLSRLTRLPRPLPPPKPYACSRGACRASTA